MHAHIHAHARKHLWANSQYGILCLYIKFFFYVFLTKYLYTGEIYVDSDNMDAMFEFRDTSENVMAMCVRYGEYMALCNYYISQGLAITYDSRTHITYVHNG